MKEFISMLMDPNLQFEEALNSKNENKEIIKKAYIFFESKTNKINKEIESIKEFIKFLIPKVIVNDNFISELNNINQCENEKNKNFDNNTDIVDGIHSKSHSTLVQNQNLFGKINPNGKNYIDFQMIELKNIQNSVNDFSKQENLYFNNLHKNPNSKNAPYKLITQNKIHNTQLNSESSNQLPKIINKSNFEKFISTPNNRFGFANVLKIKNNNINNEEFENKNNFNFEAGSLNITNNSNVPSGKTNSPLNQPNSLNFFQIF